MVFRINFYIFLLQWTRLTKYAYFSLRFYLWRLDGDKWSLWDKSFCIFVICCHIPFYFALYFDNRP